MEELERDPWDRGFLESRSFKVLSGQGVGWYRDKLYLDGHLYVIFGIHPVFLLLQLLAISRMNGALLKKTTKDSFLSGLLECLTSSGLASNRKNNLLAYFINNSGMDAWISKIAQITCKRHAFSIGTEWHQFHPRYSRHHACCDGRRRENSKIYNWKMRYDG